MADKDWLDAAAQSYQDKLLAGAQDTAEPTWISEAAKEIHETERNRLRTSLTAAADTAPDQAARIKQDAKQVGLAHEVAKRNPAELPRLRLNQAAEELFGNKDAPATRAKFADPSFAEVASDRVKPLSDFERLIRGTKALPVEHAKSGVTNVAKAALAGGAQATLGLSESIWRTPDATARYAEGVSRSIERFTGLPRWLNPVRAVQSTAEFLAKGQIPGTALQIGGTTDIADQISTATALLAERPEVFGDTFARLSQKAKEADEAFVSALDGNPSLLVETLADPEAWAGFIGQAAPSLYTAYMSGGSIPFLAWMEGMEAAGSAAEFERRTGQKVAPEQFMQATAQAATINAMLEKVGLDKVFKGEGSLASRITQAIITEGGTEGLQAFNTNVAAMLAYDPEKDLAEGVLGSIMGGAGAGAGGAILSHPSQTRQSVRTLLSDAAKVSEAIGVEAKMEQLGQMAQAEELAKRDPEAFAEFVESVVGDDADAVYIEATKFSEVLEQSGIDRAALFEELPSVAEQYAEALASNSDLRIPLGEYVTKIATQEYHQQLTPHIRLRAEGMSPAEAQEWETSTLIEFEQKAAEYAPTESVAGQQVYDRVLDQLGAIEQPEGEGPLYTREGKVPKRVAEGYARLHRVVAEAMESRGIDPMRYYGGLFVQGEAPIAAQPPGGVQLEAEQPVVELPKPEAVEVDPAAAWNEHHATAATRADLSAKQAKAVAPKPDTDPLTGLYSDFELLAALERALTGGKEYAYTESDMFNLSGANKALGANVRTDAVIKQIAEAYSSAFKGAMVFRRGAGRFAALVPPNVDISRAMQQVDEAVARIVEQNGLADIPSKVAGATGVRLYSGSTAVIYGNTVSDTITAAQNQINAAMPQGVDDVDRNTAFQTWADTAGRQTGGAAASIAADRIGRRGTPEGVPPAAPSPTATAALERAAPRVKPSPAVAPLADPDAVRQAAYERTAAAEGLTPEQAEAFRPVTHRDTLTGWFTARDLRSTISRAQHLFETEGAEAVYIVADISNLGGLNLALGEEAADVVFRNIAQIVKDYATGIRGAEVIPFRHGGDEISFIVTGASRETAKRAMALATRGVQEYVASIGLSELPHAKYPTDPAKVGTGVYVGVQDVGDTADSIDALMDEVDALIELEKAKPREIITSLHQITPVATNLRNLYVAHNIKPEGVLHAARMGGLAVPSLAIARTDKGFEGFGAITLLGTPEMLRDPAAKTFGADIYSPRYPRAEYDVDYTKWRKITEEMNRWAREAGLSPINRDTVESDGVQGLFYDDAARYAYLRSMGKAPKPTMKSRGGDLPAEFRPFIREGDIHPNEILNDPLFEEAVRGYFTDTVDAIVEVLVEEGDATIPEGGTLRDAVDVDGENVWDIEAVSYFTPEGAVSPRRKTIYANRIAEASGPARVDTYATRRNVDDRLKSDKAQQAFRAWLDETFVGTIAREQIFTGYTPSGNRRYIAHTLDNVVKLMKKELQGGESFNYGVVTIRSAAAPRFRTIKQIQAARSKIVSGEEMAPLKDEASAAFDDLAETLKPFYKYDASGFGYYDAAAENLFEMAKGKGLQDFADVPTEIQRKAAEFLVKLRDMPTEYFEAKIQRAVGLEEFTAAVVPKGTPKNVTNVLREKGLKIKTYDPSIEGDRQVKIEALDKTSDILFQKAAQKPPRGKISLAPDIVEGPNVISLLEGADLSTFLHESGHFFFEVWRDLANQPDADQSFKDDMQALLEYVGVATLDEWNAMPAEERRDGHERIARSFEAYLFEGKAPTPGLRKLFQTFAAWLRKVYLQLKQLDVNLTDEVRAVFDRMVASDEQIQLAERNLEATPLFNSAGEAGMTPEAFAEYQALQTAAHEQAVAELEARSLRDMKWLSNARNRTLKALQRRSDGVRKSIREEVVAEVQQEPVYRAMQFLKRGERVSEEGAVSKVDGPHRLDIDALETLYPNDEVDWRTLGYGAYGVLGKEGIDPDIAAEWFGFSSGDELVRALLEARPVEEVIDGITDQRMIEEHADLSDARAIEEAANEALHNEARQRMVATELQALSKLAAIRAIDRKQAKAYAEAAVAKLRVRDVKPGQFETAERRASKASAEALRKGETLPAAKAKQEQFLNGQLAAEAHKGRREVDQILEYFKKLDSKGARKRIDAEYMDQIDQTLARYDLRKAISLKAIDKRVSLRDWYDKQVEAGLVPTIDERLLDETRKEHYKNMRLGDLRELRDSIKNIEHLGKLKQKLLTAKDQREFGEVVDTLEQSIRDNATRTIPVDIEHDITVAGKELIRSFAASHRKLNSYARQMDGGKDAGPVWTYFIQPMNERGDFEAVEREKATIRFTELFDQYTSFRESAKRTAAKLSAGKFEGAKPWMLQKVFIPEIGRSLTNQGRLSVALNWGNEDNRNRIMGSYGWTEEQVQAILNTLEKSDWDFVQGVWDFIDEYWGQVEAKERRVSGIAPQKVEAIPVQTPFGTYRGGYYPIKYDQRQSPRTTELQAQDMAKRAMQGAFSRSTTRRGHTKERTGGGGQKIRLDFGTMFEHVNEVIHDLAWHEWLIDANRLLGNRKIQGALYDHYGREAYQALKSGVEDIAAGDIPAETAFERSINWIRTGTSIAGMGWSLWTSLLQPFGLTQSMARIGPKWVARGLSTWIGNAARMEKTVATIHERSDFMRLRAKTMQREINEIQNKVMAGGVMSPIQDSYFYLIVKAQQVADVPTWLGQYEKSIAEGHDEETAIRLADQAVIDSQGGGQVKDLAQIQRGSPLLKLWTNFYSYFNTTFNLTTESYRRTDFRKPNQIGRFAVDMMLLYWLPATLSALMREALKGGCGGDEECIAEAVVRENLGYMAGTMVGLREFSGFLNGFYGYQGPAGTRFFSEASKLGMQAAQGEVDEAFLKALNNAAGILFHYPAAQVQRTADGLAAAMDGDVSGGEVPPALLFGPRRD